MTGWISVEDRLPEDGVVVMLHLPRGYLPINAGYYDADERRWAVRATLDLCVMRRDVTHWMPLPDRPEDV